MSNIHADLIKNATDMQSQLLQFSNQLSNLSLKSLEDQGSFKMGTVPIFTIKTAKDGTVVEVDNDTLDKTSGFIKVTGTDSDGNYKDIVFKIDPGSVVGAGGNYNLSHYIPSGYFHNHGNPALIHKDNIFKNAVPINSTIVSFKFESKETQPTMEVTIPSTGVPASVKGGTTDQQAVAKAMAVVAMNLRGAGVGAADIKEIFKNGITPTSLAAVESQLKGHHDAVLQLSLESLSRVTQILQKIAQKLGS